MEHLGTREPITPFFAVLIHIHFDIRQELRRVLYLINQYGRGVSGQKKAGVVFRERARDRIVKRNNADFPP
jgi:hypothetical protein